MSKLSDWIARACDELGLRADVGFSLVLPNGHNVHTVARIRDIGGKNGMLIVSSFDEVKNDLDDISRSGYGFSVLEEPPEREMYDLETHREMFRDWEWFGAKTQRPSWLQ